MAHSRILKQYPDLRAISRSVPALLDAAIRPLMPMPIAATPAEIRREKSEPASTVPVLTPEASGSGWLQPR